MQMIIEYDFQIKKLNILFSYSPIWRSSFKLHFDTNISIKKWKPVATI